MNSKTAIGHPLQHLPTAGRHAVQNGDKIVRHDDFILVQGIVARLALGEFFDDLHFWVSDAAFIWRILIVENKGFAGRNSSRFGQKMAEMPKSSVRPLF
jgi:hypothetical protein